MIAGSPGFASMSMTLLSSSKWQKETLQNAGSLQEAA